MGHDAFHKSYIRFVELIQERKMGGVRIVATKWKRVIEERRAVPTLLARADEAIKWHAVLLRCDWSLLA